jgi:hypothetical protein
MTIRLPLTANQLVDAALAQLEDEGSQVKEAMVGEILPKTIQVIFQFNEQAQQMVKAYPTLKHEATIHEIAQTLWSYPGSSGAARVRNALLVQGLDENAASEISQTILNYTRYPMSIVNYMRHMRSSINSISNIFYGPKAPDVIFQELGYSKSQLTQWVASSNNLDTTRITDEDNFKKWLFEVEAHLRTFLPMQNRINRAMSGRGNVKNEKSSGLLDSFSARAYARRFGNYVAAHAKFKDVGPSTQGRGSTISDEFAELLHVYRGTDKEIYMSLLEDFERRGNRLSASASKHIERSSKNNSLFEHLVEQSLNINGKKVEIRTSSSTLPRSLVDQFVKSLNVQFEMNPNQKRLSTRLNTGVDSIEVAIDNPIKADLKKVQSFIEAMYLD